MSEVMAGAAWLDIRRCVGEGGFGVVYEAWDRRRGARVAVKVPRRLDATTIYYFKREFRALADVRHPNVVTLHDLVSDGDEWCFSMEYVDGVDLLRYLRAASAGGSEPVPPAPPPSFDRVREAFVQIVDGVGALHGAGILHRDLKPSNVLVAGDGRVVLVDFGLVKELTIDPNGSIHVTGSPIYMAPEQLAGENLSPASDWYEVGMMLYEMLTGRLPFRGTMMELLAAKRRDDVRPPHALVPEVPRDLSELCRDLLRRDPTTRPGGAEITARLTARSGARALMVASRPEQRRSLVGRTRHLRVLHDLFEATLRGRAVTVHVRGRSGMGKTALAHRFIQEIRATEPATIVLTGRCYERESVPYKALDSLIDELARHLKRLPPAEAARLLPRDAQMLARLFPVLGGVIDALTPRREPPAVIPNAQELRRRGAAALRDLLVRLAQDVPLLLVIDDLQWGDTDSGVVLDELLRPPDPPSLLLLLCYRSEDIDASPLLRMLRRRADTGGREQVQLDVGELTPAEARELAGTLLADHGGEVDGRAEALAAGSGGSPFFLGELVRHASAGAASVHVPSLDEMIRARTARMDEEARRLLEVVAVAGGPVPLGVAHAAAGFPAEEAPAVALLRAERLVRLRRTEERNEIETYHDRVREAVLHGLDAAALRVHHGRLAAAWEGTAEADPETLATHWECAGAPERAARYVVEAAERAAEALAFDRAARLFQHSLELYRPTDPRDERRLRTRLGDALANAGRVAAAEAYLAAVVDGTPDGEALELRRRAAQQLLITGHVDEGLRVLGGVLDALHMRLARTPGRALALLVLGRAGLALRGLGFRRREASALTPAELFRLDTCWSAVTGLAMVDTIRSAQFQTRHLRLALRAGEPYRVTRALALQAGHSMLRGRRSGARAERILRTAEQLAEELGHPHARGLCLTIRAAAESFSGHFRRAMDVGRAAEEVLRSQCTGATWEIDTAAIFQLHSLYWMGEWRALARRLPALQRETEERGDLYLGTYIGLRSAFGPLLVADQPEEALSAQTRCMGTWKGRGFQVQHYYDWLARAEIDLYAGRAADAWARLSGGWRTFAGSHLGANQAIFIEARHLRARAALALAAGVDRPPATLLRRVARDARAIERENAAWGFALAALDRAALAACRGRPDEAIALAARAEAGFKALEMGQYAAVARRRRGELLAGDEGRRLIEEADAWMREQDVRNPARMAAMLAPGRWDRPGAYRFRSRPWARIRL